MAGASVISSLRKLAHDVGRRLRQRMHEHKGPEFTWPLRAAVDAERHVIATADAGAISYYEDASGEGRPLVLVHGIHAAASAFEMRTLFDAFRGERPVYALDLPGFGLSQRGGMPYTAKTYVRAIEHLLRHIANEREDQRADLIALSLSSEYAANVAAELPELVHSLVLISPTGFETSKAGGRSKPPRWIQRVANTGGEVFYDALVTRLSLKHYLRKSFAGRIDRALLDYSYQTSHRPGAHFAPLAFVAGELFPEGDPQRIYAKVKVPVLVLYDEDPYTRFTALRGFVQHHSNFELVRILRTRGLPQIEARDRTLHAMRKYWERIDEVDAVERRHTDRVRGSYAHA